MVTEALLKHHRGWGNRNEAASYDFITATAVSVLVEICELVNPWLPGRSWPNSSFVRGLS